MWMDSRPDLFLQYKIQPVRDPSPAGRACDLSALADPVAVGRQKQQISAAEEWFCTRSVLYNHFFFELQQMMAFHPMAVYVGIKTFEVPLPAFKTVARQPALFFLVKDTWHYW